MKHLKFNKFRSERDLSKDEAARLIKLKKQIKHLKRQRLIIIAGACLSTAIIVYLATR